MARASTHRKHLTATSEPRAAVAAELEHALCRLPQAVVGIAPDRTVLFANAEARTLFRGTPLRRGRPFPERLGPFSLERVVDELVAGGQVRAQLLELPDGRTLRLTGSGARGDDFGLLLLDDVTTHVRGSASERSFVRNAAHQLRTPLAAIATAVEVLQAGAKDDPRERDHFLAHIERVTQRLGRLTRALLVLARAQAGLQAPGLQFVLLGPVLSAVAADALTAPGVEIAVSCPTTLAALAESDLLTEALVALVENAVQHTSRGKITLRAAARDDETVEIEVEDSGAGIAPELQEHVFEPFARGSADGNGFGLGLAIAQQAVAAMGSTLAVESEPGHGSRFSFRLRSAEVVA